VSSTERQRSRRSRQSGRARGYTLVVLMIGMTVMSILIASVLPLASAERQRDREAELIFRGRQYAEGIRIYRRRYGRYPNTLKEMLETRPRTLRKLWKDPITDSDNWGLITMTTLVPIVPTPTGPNRTPVPSPTPSPTPSTGIFGDKEPGAGGQPIGPIMGVYSLSKKKGYRLWNGREGYDEWHFDESSLTPQGEGGNTPNGLPGPGIGGGPPGGSGLGGPAKK
jgi:type II secretory pathway pseudopilin PulG